ncbi:CYTH domain-containing protein [Halomonas sp. HP20-15]|uniref:CYTH domain-containing protein n=1 Tax=Halomonas sp. HP20-15 TaxID=3085901 RepID=UPI002980A6BC|nr:CYTH domain-containing protein [Halomonas sp. HP20-15]MDW5377298.1 CYTH domain-containing protein [Halomonas sp. HP20-15]
MAKEIELKLALGQSGAQRLAAHPRLAGLSARHETLTNTYYDTPDGELERHRVALRLRRTPQRILQTLKTAGEGSGGLSSRGEWEWPVSEHVLDLAGLEALAPMQALGRDVLLALEPRFATDFARTSWLVEDAETAIEVALDQGEIRAGSHRVAIDELELELKRGAPSVLWRFAETLAEEVALRPANASKAARGAALCTGHWPAITTNSGAELRAATPRQRCDRAIAALDALGEGGESEGLSRAREAFASLAEDTGLATAIRQPARRLAAALDEPQWLTPSFGQHSLALLAALDAR